MSIVFLDLEWNNAYSKLHGKFVNEIIEIGAVKLDDSYNIIDRIDIIIRSQITNKLTGRFKSLTNITNEEMREGIPFDKAITKFLSWCGTDFLTVTWSNSDLYAIIENFNLFYGRFPTNCFENYLDLQRFYQSVIPTKDGNQISLKAAAESLEISLEDVALHRASDDSAVTAEIFKRITKLGDYSLFVKDTRTDDFYERLTFHPYCIDDINSPYILPNDLIFECEDCKTISKATSEWRVVNKQFSNVFCCPNCNKKFLGRVRIKKYFDYTRVKKSQLPIIKKSKQDTVEIKDSEVHM